MHDDYSMLLPLRLRSTRPSTSTTTTIHDRLALAAPLLVMLTVAGCGSANPASNTKPEALPSYDTVTLSASSCQNGCANAPTITARSSSCNIGNSLCAEDCEVLAATNIVTFEFNDGNGVIFTSDASCNTTINGSPTGSSYSYSFKWKDTHGMWQCVSDPTITVQSGVCTGHGDD